MRLLVSTPKSFRATLGKPEGMILKLGDWPTSYDRILISDYISGLQQARESVEGGRVHNSNLLQPLSLREQRVRWVPSQRERMAKELMGMNTIFFESWRL
jgi:hypothetical protein